MAVSKRTKNPLQRRVFKFPEAKSKSIASVELDVSSAYNILEIKFQDKTALVLDLEPCVMVFPQLVNWQTGNSRPLKRWRPVHSRTSRR